MSFSLMRYQAEKFFRKTAHRISKVFSGSKKSREKEDHIVSAQKLDEVGSRPEHYVAQKHKGKHQWKKWMGGTCGPVRPLKVLGRFMVLKRRVRPHRSTSLHTCECGSDRFKTVHKRAEYQCRRCLKLAH